MCSFLGCNLSIPFSLGEAVPLSGETGSCETEYYILHYVNTCSDIVRLLLRGFVILLYTVLFMYFFFKPDVLLLTISCLNPVK